MCWPPRRNDRRAGSKIRSHAIHGGAATRCWRKAAKQKLNHGAIAFELGGVLVDCGDAAQAAARRVADSLQLAVPERAWSSVRGDTFEAFFRDVLMLPDNQRCAVTVLQAALLASEEFLRRAQDSACLLPHVLELLEFSRRNFRFVAITTSSEWRLVDSTLRRFGLERYFDGIVSGDHVTQGKPAPEGHLVTAWLLGVRPTELIAVESSNLGIRAARLARARVIGIAVAGDPTATRGSRPDYVAADHGELLEHVRHLSRCTKTDRTSRVFNEASD